MATTTDLFVGLAEHLAAAGIGTWRVTGLYAKDETGILIGAMPASPDRVIVLTPYPVTRELDGSTLQGIQVRTRAPGLPTAVNDLDEAIYAELHGRESLTLGGVQVSLIEWRSGAPLGRDSNGRTEHSANYYAHLGMPTAHTR